MPLDCDHLMMKSLNNKNQFTEYNIRFNDSDVNWKNHLSIDYRLTLYSLGEMRDDGDVMALRF